MAETLTVFDTIGLGLVGIVGLILVTFGLLYTFSNLGNVLESIYVIAICLIIVVLLVVFLYGVGRLLIFIGTNLSELSNGIFT